MTAPMVRIDRKRVIADPSILLALEVEHVVVHFPPADDPLRSTAALILSSARGIPLWTSRGMLSTAVELAITARVNLEWGEARKRFLSLQQNIAFCCSLHIILERFSPQRSC